MVKSNICISLCIPTHNGSLFIRDCLDSIIHQYVYPDEIIVSDDNSIDDTLKIIDTYRDRFSKLNIPLKIFKRNFNSISLNCNYLVDISKSDYIKFLFQDDYLLPECIKHFKSSIGRYKNKSLYVSYRKVIVNSPDNIDCIKIKNGIKSSNLDKLQLPDLSNGLKTLNNNNFWLEPINKFGEPSNIVVRKINYQEIGGFDTNFKQLLDLDLYIRLMQGGELVLIKQVLSCFRIHSGQASVKNRISGIAFREKEIFYRKLILGDIFSKLKTDLRSHILSVYTSEFTSSP
jgi:glycosyltransferase involved in cell wall biosynthesis